MSFDLLPAVVADRFVAAPGPHGSGYRMCCPIIDYDTLLPSQKRLVHDAVIAGGIEAWVEHGFVFFHRARLPLHRSARDAHARRVAFLLEEIEEG